MKLSVRTRPMFAGLIVLNLCLCGLLGARLIGGTRAAAIIATKPATMVLFVPESSAPARPGDWAALQANALFYSSRRFYEPPPPAAAPLTPPHPDYKIVGTVIIPYKPTVAVLTGPGGAIRKVKPGDLLDSWTVRVVETRRVILDYEGESFEIAVADSHATNGLRRVSSANGLNSETHIPKRILGNTGPAGPPVALQPGSARARLYRSIPK